MKSDWLSAIRMSDRIGREKQAEKGRPKEEQDRGLLMKNANPVHLNPLVH